MFTNILEKIFEHNNWANLKIIEACYALSDAQLDAVPQTATKGTIRRTLEHLVHSQQHYLDLLTLPVEARLKTKPAFAELVQVANTSGEKLIALVRGEPNQFPTTRIQTEDGYWVEPWVVMVQIINHATEHREQISSMLTALGVTPPDMDGWSIGDATHALVPIGR